MNPTRDSVDSGPLARPLGLGGAPAAPPFGPEVIEAGGVVVARLTAGRARAAVMGIDGAHDTLVVRAPWACCLLGERQRLGSPAADRHGWMTAALASDALDPILRSQIAGLWRLLERPTPMGDDPTGWSFLIARWLIAPLLPPATTATVRDWTRMLVSRGESRRAAREHARHAVADALECERGAGPALWVDLCRSQFTHPVQVSAVGNIIRAANQHANVP